jgi:hypothetical protein
MIVVVEGPMGCGMSMIATYMAFMLRKHLKNDPKVRPVTVDYEMKKYVTFTREDFIKEFTKYNMSIEDYNEKI